MKNFIVANLALNRRYNRERLDILVESQIANSLELGWDSKDIILLSNIEYDLMGVKSITGKLNRSCLTGSKVFGMKFLFDNDMVNETIWAHDLDAWQNVSFDCPAFEDVGIACYSKPKFNGGSVFWRPTSKDIVNKIVRTIKKHDYKREEPTLNKILKAEKYSDRVTVLNNTFNVGCSGYTKRWQLSIKPLHVCHFHPYNRIAWETHVLDRNGLDVKGVSDRLENLLRKYYPDLATELSEEGKFAQRKRREKRLKELVAG